MSLLTSYNRQAGLPLFRGAQRTGHRIKLQAHRIKL